MKLDEFVKAQKDDAILAIGASSGFIFVGTKAQYEDEIDKSYKRARANARDLLSDAENRLRALRLGGFDGIDLAISIPEDNAELPEAFRDWRLSADRLSAQAQLLRNYTDKFEAALKSKERAEYTLNKCSYREREVKESYRAIRRGQINVIIEGVEGGRFWTLEENEEVRGNGAKKDTRNNEPS